MFRVHAVLCMGCLACLWRLARLPRGLPRLPLATGSVASCTQFLPFWSFCDSSIHSFFPISGFAVAFAQRAEGFTGNTSRPQLELLTTSTNYIYTASNTSSDLKDSTPTTTKKMTSPAALFQDKLGESDRGGQVFIYTNFSGGCMVKKAYKKKRYILLLVKTLSRRAG